MGERPDRDRLISLLAGITYGIEPYGTHPMGWTSCQPAADRRSRLQAFVADWDGRIERVTRESSCFDGINIALPNVK